MNEFNWIKNCLCCNSDRLETYLDLGDQPLANSYHLAEEKLESYPLQVQLCTECFHSQLTAAVNPDLLYKHYLYVSGTSSTLTEYFKWFVSKVGADFKKHSISGRNVLDIASNDGTLLKAFKQDNWTIQGVDPAENLAEFSAKNGVPTLVAYWGLETAKRLTTKYDAIIAQNVVAHLPYPFEFLQACKSVLSEDGRIYLQTSQADMFVRNEFDTIYHEHHSFFSANSMKRLAERAGLYVVDTFKVPVHGTSYVFVLAKKPGDSQPINDLIEAEKKEGRYEREMYQQFAKNARTVTADLAKTVADFKSRGIPVVGFGAAAKGMTLLNFGKIKLDYIVDDNPLKWNLLTPGMDIPIADPEVLSEEKSNLAFVVLAWNFFDEIVGKIRSRRSHKDDSFIQYFPAIRIV